MQPILVACGTTEGQTRATAEFIAERLRPRGQRIDGVHSMTPCFGRASLEAHPVRTHALADDLRD